MSILAAVALPRYVELQDRTRVSVMKADLYHLRLVQEQYRRGEAGTYAESVTELDGTFMPSPEVRIVIVRADADHYLATASHGTTRLRCAYSSGSGIATCGSAGGSPDLRLDPASDSAVGAQ